MSNEEQLCHLRELTPSGIEDESASMGLQDRRRFLRARVDSSAFVLVARRYVGAYVVRDLSAGGAHLVGDNNLTIGQVVQILLRVGKQLSQVSKPRWCGWNGCHPAKRDSLWHSEISPQTWRIHSRIWRTGIVRWNKRRVLNVGKLRALPPRHA